MDNSNTENSDTVDRQSTPGKGAEERIVDRMLSAMRAGAEDARQAAQKALPKIKSAAAEADYWGSYGIAFAAVFAGVGTVEELSTTITAAMLVGGVFLGSLLWFGTLSALTYLFRNFLRTKGLDLINRITGSLIVLFGTAAIVSGLV